MTLNSSWISTNGYTHPLDSSLLATFGEIKWLVPEGVLINDHVARAQSLLIEQFKKRPKINSIVKAIVQSVQKLEYVFVDLLSFRFLDKAYGAQLDGLGEIVGEQRNGLNDTDYREAIRFRIYINISSGEPETLIKALKFVTKATRIRIFEYPDATLQMFTNGSFVPDNLTDTMEKIAPAGVNIDYIGTSYNTLPFSISKDDGSPDLEGGGWNELGYAPSGQEAGGQFVEGHT